MKIPNTFGLYAILTDPIKGYEYMTRLFVDQRVAFIQLRMKKAPPAVIATIAEKLRAITAGTESRFIINDDPQLAARVRADGIHIGQDDMPCEEVRTIVGENCLIGLSTHSPAQTQSACRLTVDYIGVGPVFPTPTKEKPDPAIGVKGMAEMLAQATVPAVAIGGIDLKNLPEVLKNGAKNFCMVRQLMQADNPESIIREIKQIRADF